MRNDSWARSMVAALVLVGTGCSQPAPENPAATAGIDSLNARLVQAYRTHDPRAYGALYTDTAVFEWPAFNTVRGPEKLAAMAKDNWTNLRDMDLRLTVANRRVAADQATEFGAFEQSWADSSGSRMTEYGRYASVMVRQKDGTWLLDRFLGFEDSTRSAARVAQARKTVLFVCEHGTVRSLIAKVLFEEYAKQIGLDMAAVSRGTRPDSAVPAWMTKDLAADHIALGSWRPQALAPGDLASAAYVVSFDVPTSATADAHAPRVQWDGLPSVSANYVVGRDAIKARVHVLADSLKRASVQVQR